MAEELYRLLLITSFLIQCVIISFVPYIGSWLSIIHYSWLHALYSFEYKWSLEGWKVETRIEYFERRWAYFCGFGLPAALIGYFFPKWIGSGFFALTFPLVCSMLKYALSFRFSASMFRFLLTLVLSWMITCVYPSSVYYISCQCESCSYVECVKSNVIQRHKRWSVLHTVGRFHLLTLCLLWNCYIFWRHFVSRTCMLYFPQPNMIYIPSRTSRRAILASTYFLPRLPVFRYAKISNFYLLNFSQSKKNWIHFVILAHFFTPVDCIFKNDSLQVFFLFLESVS